MRVKEALFIASEKLSKSVRNPKKEAMILLGHFLNKESVYLLAHDNDEVENLEWYFELIERRVAHEPIEYITGHVSFYSREFHIKSGVLVPRPETEILVDKASSLIEELGAREIAEIGVGSGVISIMLALKLPHIRIIGSDISPEAIELSRQNARKFGVLERIEFVCTSFLDGIKTPEIIVSNPPYISKKEELEKHVLKEPHSALFGGEQGDEMLKHIVKLGKNVGVKALACEMGYDQKESLEAFFKAQEIKNYSFYQDLSGLDRGFIVKGF